MAFFFFKQKTAYEIVSGDWSSDVCSSDLRHPAALLDRPAELPRPAERSALLAQPGHYRYLQRGLYPPGPGAGPGPGHIAQTEAAQHRLLPRPGLPALGGADGRRDDPVAVDPQPPVRCGQQPAGRA